MLVDWPFPPILLGGWLAMLLMFSVYNLLQGYILRERFRLTLGLLGLSISVTEAYFYRVPGWFSLELQQALAPYVASVTVVAITVLASRFTRAFLRFAERIPEYDRHLATAEAVVMMPLAALLFLPPQWVAVAQLTIGVLDAMLWTLAFRAARASGGVDARLMALAWPGIALGALLWFARNLGFINGSPWLSASYVLGLALEGVAVSLALSYRLKKLADDSVAALASAQAANQETLALQDQLRAEIATRTAELRQQERRADEEYRSKQAFLSLISHDLRGPLSSASQGVSRLLTQWQAGDWRAANTRGFEALLYRVDETLVQQVGLVDRLLDIEALRASTRDAANAVLPPCLTLHDEVASCLDTWRERFAGRGIELHNQTERGATVCADPLLLRAMLENLLGNALRHSRPGGRVWIEQSAGARQGVCVANTVAELSATARAKILGEHPAGADLDPDGQDPSAAADALFTALGSGRSLGLTLARQMMRARGGDLQPEINETVVRFHILLPAVPCRILVVDDQPVQIARLKERLHALVPDAALLDAESVAAALQRLAERPVELILSDVRMPDADGFALLDAVRANTRLEHIPFVLLSAVDSIAEADALRQRAARTGADDFYPKPLSDTDLAELVRYLPAMAPGGVD
mgnify:CR=1 FL=1